MRSTIAAFRHELFLALQLHHSRRTLRQNNIARAGPATYEASK